MNLSVTYLVYLLKNPQKLESLELLLKAALRISISFSTMKFQVLGELTDGIFEASMNSD